MFRVQAGAGAKIGSLLVTVLIVPALLLGRSLGAQACAVDGAKAYQPTVQELEAAFHKAGVNTLGPGYPIMPNLEAGSPNQTPVSPAVPCVLLKAIAYTESGWKQARQSVPRGGQGEVLVAPSCGYGLMQVTSGMRQPGELDPSIQQRIATDYKFNLAWGAKILADKWNLAPEYRPVVGSRQPSVAENWYYAVWSYNGWLFKNNPQNPDLPWPRPPFNGIQSRTNYPYQELVWGYSAHPPSIDGRLLWESVPLTLPPREQIGLNPSSIPTPQPSHENACQALQVGTETLYFLAEVGGRVYPQKIRIGNAGMGDFAWKALVSGSTWLTITPEQGKAVPVDLIISVNPAGLKAGRYTARVTMDAGGIPGSPKSIEVHLYVGDVWRLYLPDLLNNTTR